MKLSSLSLGFGLLASSIGFATAATPSAPLPPQQKNSTYTNPILPGWHSDPSCAQVDGIFYCVTSTFISFPGLPVYASRDLRNWKLVSHAWSRESQLPGLSWNTSAQQQGMYAATLRYHEPSRLFYVICEYLGSGVGYNVGVVFKSSDPFRGDESWSDPVTFKTNKIDPDLFWDTDPESGGKEKAYVATQGILLQEIDLDTGELSQPPLSIWNGTGGVWPEGPHLYKRDGWYYLMIAEGGTEENHSVTIARSRKLKGPYEAYEKNPILTNRGTDEYFQTVGHGDLFQDTKGNWWGVALATRTGPEYKVYPMGRETVLYPVSWPKDSWPILQPVRGQMSGWPLPRLSRELPGTGPFNSDPDDYTFARGTSMPRNLVHWRVPRPGTFTISPRGRDGLQIVPSRNNLTGTPLSQETPELSGQQGLAFVGRRQTDSLFEFSVDFEFEPRVVGHEAGVTVFLTQVDHIDLGVVLLPSSSSNTQTEQELSLRFRTEGSVNSPGTYKPPTRIVPVPKTWLGQKQKGNTNLKLRLQIETLNSTHYSLSALPLQGKGGEKLVVATAPAELVSGGNGSFVGSLVGAYATCNGAGEGVTCPPGGNAYVTRWRYRGKGQYVSATELVY
ncbi:glycoside hydrolase family 43 protein [Xylariaceae sp. FL0594]|nr:glycoside hydrolase family 43 protein [Xylariaceae sp. FL0594]